jgi:hypothetical protein
MRFLLELASKIYAVDELSEVSLLLAMLQQGLFVIWASDAMNRVIDGFASYSREHFIRHLKSDASLLTKNAEAISMKAAENSIIFELNLDIFKSSYIYS